MELGISSGTLFPRKDRVRETFAFAAESGLDGVEIICDRQFETHDAEYLRGCSAESGIPVMSLHAPFPGHAPESWGADPRAVLSRSCALAQELGARHVVTHLPERFYFRRPGPLRVPAISSHGRRLRELMVDGALEDLEDEYDLKICVENLPRQFRLIPDTWLIYWNTLPEWASSHRYLTLDTTHWATKQILPESALEAAGNRVRHVHLSNYLPTQEHLPPQYGSLDLRRFLSALPTVNQHAIVILELTTKYLPEDSAERTMALRHSVQFARDSLALQVQ